MNYKSSLRFVSILILLVSQFHSVSLGQVDTELIPSVKESIPVNGMQMYYEVYGQGQPLVLLHGFLSSGKIWTPFVKAFADSFLVIVPDLRGHGHSTNPGGEFTHRQSALDVYALLDHLAIDRFKAMGTSTGGMTLLHMATQQHDRIESMVLIGSSIYFPDEARAVMEQTNFESRNEPVFAWVNDHATRGDEQLRMLFSQFHGFKDSYEDMNFTAPLLSTIEAKTLIVHGDRDVFFPVNIPVEMYNAIPNSYLWIVPNGGHVPIYDIALEFVNRAMSFLSEMEESPFMSGSR